jgi:hypothetical protein
LLGRVDLFSPPPSPLAGEDQDGGYGEIPKLEAALASAADADYGRPVAVEGGTGPGSAPAAAVRPRLEEAATDALLALLDREVWTRAFLKRSQDGPNWPPWVTLTHIDVPRLTIFRRGVSL